MNKVTALLVAALSLLCLPALQEGGAPAPARGRAVFVLRHAEAAALPGERDPGLSEEGRARAAALARLLGSAGVTQLYASEYERTQATLVPLAEALERAVEVVPAGEGEALVAKLRALPAGAVAVVAGHSNTVPAIVAALGGELGGLEEHPRYGPVLGHDEYDRLVLVTLPPGADAAPQTIELRYGE